jgi:PAS domain S-box-containing protein
MQVDAFVLALAIFFLLSAAIIVPMAMKIVSQRRKLRQSDADQTMAESQHAAAIKALEANHQIDIGRVRKRLLEPFVAAETASFRVSLEDDRLSRMLITYHASLEALAHADSAPESETAEHISFDAALNRIHRDDRAMVRNALIDSLSRQRPLNVIFRSIEPDESQKYLGAKGKTISLNDSGTVEMIGTISDLTELIESRQTDNANHEILESLLDLVPWGIWAVDSDSLITMWNKQMEELTGILSEKVIGRKNNSTEAGLFKDAICGQNFPDKGPTSFTFKPDQNSGKTFKVILIPVSGHDATNRQTFGILQMQQPRVTGPNRSTEMEALGRLTSGVAHDFANLVHVILGYTDILKQDLKDQPIQLDDVGQIHDAGTRAEELVYQLLAFCSKDSLNARDNDLNAVIDNFTGLLKRIAGDNITLRFHSDPDIHTTIADTSQIEKILLSLIIRAKECLPDGGLIAISTKNVTVEEGWLVNESDMIPGDYVKLSVSDNGNCLPSGESAGQEEDEPSLFKSIKEIMSSIGGYLNVHASSDIGTTVSMYFKSTSKPGTEQGEVSRTSESGKKTDAAAAPTTRATILVVEDDASVRKLTAKALKQAGHVVLEAGDGIEAMKVFNQNPDKIDLLITDVIMPGMNGREVCDEIKRIKPDLPVLFCSGYSSDLLENEYMLNIQGLVIQKPYRSADLLATAAKLVAAGSASQGNLPI